MIRLIGLFCVLAAAFLLLDIAVGHQATREWLPYSFFTNTDSKPGSPRHWSTLLLFACTLLGIASGELHRYAMQHLDHSGLNALKEVVRSTRFLAAGLVSPIAFGVAYSQCRNQPDVWIALIAAFENGFFWNTILARREDVAEGIAVLVPRVSNKRRTD